MSLINDVLRDLDKKKSPKKARRPMPDMVSSTAPPRGYSRSSYRFPGVFGLCITVCFIIAIGGIAIVIWHHPTKTAQAITVPKSNSVILPTAKHHRHQQPILAKQWVATAQQLINDNHADQALALLSTPAVANSSDVKAIQLLVMLLVDDHQTEQAKGVVDTALLKFPSAIELQYAKAYYLFHQKQFGEALDVLQQFNPPIEKYPDFYGLMAQLYLQQNQTAMALSLYRLLVEDQPNEARWWLGMAVTFQAEGRYDDAHTAFKKAYELNHLPLVTMAYIKTQLNQAPAMAPI